MSSKTANIPVSQVQPNPMQPRTVFDQDALQELANSIRENGLQSPILVEDNHNGTYTLVAGERRLRAHKLLGCEIISAIVREPTDHHGKQRLIDAVTENVQRDNMNPVDEGNAYLKMSVEFKMSVRDISKQVGIYETRISAMLKVARLEEPIKQLIADRRLPHSPEVIEALYSLPAGKVRIEFAQGAAARSATIKIIKASAARLLNALQDKTLKGTPAVVIGKRFAKQSRKKLPDWNALSHLKKLPPWALLVHHIEATCDVCSLREVASESTCGDCPLVELVRSLMEHTHVP